MTYLKVFSCYPPSLRNEAIIGCQFLREYGIIINFNKGTFSYVRGTELREHSFTTNVGLRKVISDDRRETENLFRKNNPSGGQRPEPLSADCESNFPTRAVHSCSNPTPHQTVQEGTLEDKGEGEDIQVICETQCRSKEEVKGSSSLHKGTESDQFIKDVQCMRNDTSYIQLSSQMVCYVSRDAAIN
jgi:hypothetical protein